MFCVQVENYCLHTISTTRLLLGPIYASTLLQMHVGHYKNLKRRMGKDPKHSNKSIPQAHLHQILDTDVHFGLCLQQE